MNTILKKRIALILCISMIMSDSLTHISYANENDTIEMVDNSTVEMTTYHEEYQETTQITVSGETYDIVSTGSDVIDDEDIEIYEDEEDSDVDDEDVSDNIVYEEEPEEDEMIEEVEEDEEIEEENIATTSDILEDEAIEDEEAVEKIETKYEEEYEEDIVYITDTATDSDVNESIDVDEYIDIATISDIEEEYIDIATVSDIEDEYIDIATKSDIEEHIDIATKSDIEECIDIATASDIDELTIIATSSDIIKNIDIATSSEINDIEILDSNLYDEIFGLSNKNDGLVLLGSPITSDDYVLDTFWFSNANVPKEDVTEITFKKGGSVPEGYKYFYIRESNSLEGYTYEYTTNVDGKNVKKYKVIIYADDDSRAIKLTAEARASRGLFDGFVNLEKIIGLEYLDTSEATDLNGMFNLCAKLTEVNVSQMSTKKVTDMSLMFSNCIKLKFYGTTSGSDNHAWTNFDTSRVTNMKQMFYNCCNATELYLNTFNTENVTNMTEMFCMKTDVSKLTYIYVGPCFTVTNVKESEHMFFQCKKLKAIDAEGEYSPFKEDIVDKTYALITGRKYNGYLSLVNINNDPSSNYIMRSELTDLFNEIDNLNYSLGHTLNISTVKPYSFSGLYGTKYESSIKRYNPITKTKEKVFDFVITQKLITLDKSEDIYESYLVVPDKTKVIDGLCFFCVPYSSYVEIDCEKKFNCSSSIRTISGLEHLDFSTCTKFDNMFAYGYNLSLIEGFNTIDTHLAETMDKMFFGTEGLREIDIRNFDVRNCKSFQGMFQYSNIQYIKLCNFNTYEHANYHLMFADCYGLQKHKDCGLENLARFGEKEPIRANDFLRGETRWGNINPYFIPLRINYKHSIENSNHILNKHTFDYLPIPKSEVKKITIDISDDVPRGGKMFPIDQKHGAMAGYLYDNGEVVLYGRKSPVNIAQETKYTVYDEFDDLNPPVYYDDGEGNNILDPEWYPLEFFCHFDEDASSTFEGFTNLEEIVNLDTVFIDKVKNAKRMFYGCEKLKNIQFCKREQRWFALNDNIIPNQTFEECEDFSYAFYGCKKVKSIENVVIRDLIDAISMYEECSSLKYVSFKPLCFDLTKCDRMFYNCSSLEKIIIYSGFLDLTYSCTSGSEVFTGCVKLKGDRGTVYSPTNVSYDYGHVDYGTSNPGYFSSGIDNYYLPADWYKDLYELVDTEYNGLYHTIYDIEKQMYLFPVLDTIKIEKSGRTKTKKKIIHDSYGLEVYIDCLEDKTDKIIDPYIAIGIPDTSKPIYTYESCEKMFCGFKDLVKIEGLDKINFENAKDMTLMFAENEKLEVLMLGSNFKTPNLMDTSAMFRNDKNLKSIMFPYEYNFDMSKVTLPYSKDMFLNCEKLVGYRGTSYDNDMTKCEYARLDDGMSNPGYFSRVKYKLENTWSDYFTPCTVRKFVFQYGDIPLDKYEINGIEDGYFVFNKYYDTVNQIIYLHSPFEKESISVTIFKTGYLVGLFGNCTKLESFENLPIFSYPNYMVDASYMFYHAESLKEINFLEWGFDKAKVCYAEQMFYYCYNLLTIKNFDKTDFSDAEDAKLMFYECGISSLSMKNMNLSKIRSVYSMFYKCNNLSEIDLTNTILPEDISGFFANHKNLQKVIGVASASNVKNVSEVFLNCEKLSEIDMTGMDLSNCVTTRRMFESCKNLKEIKGIGTVDFNKCKDMSAMFKGCTNFEKIDLRSTVRTEKSTDNDAIVYNIDDLCRDCENLRYVNLGTFNDANVSAKSLFYNCKKLEFTYLHDAHIKYGDEMFYGCNALKRIGVLNDNRVGTGEGKNIFTNCNLLLDPAGHHYHNESNDYARTALYAATDILPIWLGYFSYVYDIDRSWVNNLPISKESVTKISFVKEPKVPTGTKFIANDNRYWHNNNLYGYVDGTTVNIHIPNYNTILVADTDLSGLFSGLTNLQEIENIELLETYQTFDMSDMFSDCKKLSEINLKSICTTNLENTKNMFKGDNALETIFASSSFRIDNITESENMFYGCTAIVGGNNTRYDASKVDHTYARLDVSGTPGYFSDTKCFNDLILKDQGVLTPKIQLYSEANPGVIINKAFVGQNVIVDCTGLNYLLNNINVYLDYESEEYEDVGATYKSKSKYAFTMKDCNVTISITGEINDNHARYYFSGDSSNTTLHFTKTFTDRLDDYYTFGEAFIEATVSEVRYVKWDTKFQPNTVENLFKGFKKISTVNFYEIDLKNVTSMKSACAGCESMKKVILPSNDRKIINDISYMFEGCTSLTEVDFSLFYSRSVRNMEGLFKNCTAFTAIDLTSLDTSLLHNATDMFSGCTNLKEIYCYSFNVANLPESQVMFDGCVNLEGECGTKYSVENDKTAKYAYLDSVEKKGYFSVPLGKVYYYVDNNYTLHLNSREVDRHWSEYFSGSSVNQASLIKKVIIETRIHPTWCLGFFAGLTNLREIVNIENLSTKNIEIFSNMFAGINGANNKGLILDISALDFSSAITMKDMFNGSKAISCIYANSSFTVPSGCTTTGMFAGCDNLMGSKGTRYNSRKVDGAYAKIDGGSASPGYFSEKVPMKGIVYWGLNDDETELHLAGYKTGPYNWHNDNYTYESLTSDQKIKIKNVVIDNEILPTNCQKYFEGMNILNDIENIHYINTDFVTNLQGMFSGDKNITYLDLARFNTTNVTDMSDMFYHCDSLSYLYIDSFNTKNVKNMSNMFYHCDSLESVNIINFDTMNVTNMSGMFEYFGMKDELNLTAFNTKNVTDMKNMFANMKNVVNIDVSNFNTENVINMSGMFDGCINLEEIVGINVLDTSKVENMSKMFKGLSKIKTLELYELDTQNVMDMSAMFASSENLHRIYVSDRFVLDKVLHASDMFTDCHSIVGGAGTIYDSTNVDSVYARYDKGASEPGYFCSTTPIEGVVYWYLNDTKDVLNLTTICPEEVDYSTDKWNYNMNSLTDAEKSNVTEVYVFNDFGSIMPVNMKGWFKDFTSLTNFEEFSKIYTENVKDMSHLFDNCTVLSNIDINYINTKNTTNMSYMFNNCTSMTNIDVSRFDTKKVMDMSYMFSNLNVTNIDVSKLDTTNVTNYEGMFSGSLNIEKLHLETFDTKKATNMKNMFANQTNLYRIYVTKKFDTSSVTVSDGMFSGCTSLYGSAGTKCETVFDVSYAKMDGGTLDPGYFMSDEIKKGVIYWKLTDSDTVLHLFGICPDDIDYTTGVWNYDDNNNSLSKYAIDVTKRKNINKVVIDVEDGEKLLPAKMDSWFKDFEKLTTIDSITNLDTSDVTTTECLFENCKKLDFLFLPNIDTTNVTNMNYMFKGIDVNGLSIGIIDTAKTTSMKGMFADCKNLTSFDFTNNDISELLDTSYMFNNCISLTNVKFATNGTSLENTESMFEGCTKLERVYADVDFDSLISSNNMFYNCTNIKAGNSTIYDTSHIDGSYAKVDNLTQKGYFTTDGYHDVSVDTYSSDKIKIYIDGIYDHEAFNAFPNQKIIIKAIDVGTWQTVSKEDIKLSISSDTPPVVNIEEVMGEANTFSFMMPAYDTEVSFSISVKSNNIFYYKSTDEKTLYLTKNSTYVANVYEFGNTFDDAIKNGINTVVIEYPSDSKNYKPDTLKHLFDGFTDLHNVFGLNYIDAENVTDASYMFNGCVNLINADLRGVDLNDVNDFTNMFYNCSNLENINVNDDFELTGGASCTNMFYNCVKIIGGNNTLFDATYISGEYARIDKVSQKGYLTDNNSHNITINKSLVCTYSIIRGSDNLSDIKRAVSGEEVLINVTPYIWQENIELSIIQKTDGRKILCTETSSGSYIYSFIMPDYDIEFNECKSDIKENYCFYHSTPSEANPSKKILYLTTDIKYYENVYHFGDIFDSTVSIAVEKVIASNVIKPTTLANIFSGFSSLVSFDIDKISTLNITSLANMCDGCESLVSIKNELDALITDNVDSYSAMFRNCTNLTELNLISFKTARATNFDNMFYGDSSLHTIFVSNNFIIDAAASGSDMFKNCTSIEGKIKISDTEYDVNKTVYDDLYVDTTYAKIKTNVQDGYFTYNGELELNKIYWKVDTDKLYLSSYKKDGWNNDYVNQKSTIANKSSITTVRFENIVLANNLDSWFEGFTSLTTFENFDNLNVMRVTSMKKLFKNCENIEELDLRSFDTSIVTDMSEMFYGDKNLVSIYATEKFDVTSVTNSNNMFYNCTSIMGSNGTRYNSAKINKEYARFDEVGQLGYINNGFSNNILCSCPTGITYKLYRENDNVEVHKAVLNQPLIFEIIGVNEWQTIRSISINDNIGALSYTNITDTKYRFLMSDTDVSINNIVYDINEDYAFYYLTDSEKTLHLTRNESANVYKFGSAFATSVSEKVEKVVFESRFNASTYKSLFNNFKSLSTIGNFYNIGFNKATDVSYMFNNCGNLVSVDLSSVNISSASNTSYMFNDCQNLETIKVADGFEFKNITYSNNMFYNCKKLVGGNGTVFDNTKIDATYAKIDKIANDILGAADQIGYFTDDHSYTLTVNNDAEMIDVYRGVSSYKSSIYEKDQFVYIKIKSNYYKIDSIDINVISSNKSVDMVVEYVDSAEYIFQMPEDNVSIDFTYSIADDCLFYTIEDNVLTVVKENKSDDSAYKYYRFGYKFEDIGSKRIANVETIIFNDDVETDTLAHLFDGFTNLTNVEGFEHINGKIEDTSYMFDGCKKLSDISFFDIDTSEVIDMNDMFANTGFKTLYLTDFDTSNMTFCKNMFYNSSSLEKIYVSDKFIISGYAVGDFMFSGCTKLIGGNGTRYDSTKTNIAYAYVDDLVHEGCFSGDTSHNVSIDKDYKYKDKLKVFKAGLESVNIPYAVEGQELYVDVNNLEVWQKVDKVIISYAGGSKIYATKVAGYDTRYVFTMPAFDVSISANIVIDSEYAFYYKSGTTLHLTTDERYKSNVYKFGNTFGTTISANVTDVIIDDYFAPSTIKNIFSSFTKLKKYDISKIGLSSITDISYMFKNCKALTNVNINQLFISNIINYEGLFDGCTGLTVIDMNDADLSKAKNVKYMFRNCSNLSTIFKDVEYIYQSDIVSDDMFAGSTKLIGGNNTKYDSTKTNILYANPDIAGRKGYYTNDKVFTITKNNDIKDVINVYMTGEDAIISKAVASQSITLKLSNAYPDSIVYDIKITDATDDTVVLPYTEVRANKEYKFDMQEFDVNIAMTIYKVDEYTHYYVRVSDGSIHYTGKTVATYSDIIKGTYIFGENIDYAGKNSIGIAYIDCEMKPKTLANMFNEFTSLASVSNISRLNTSECKNMKNMFADCSSLPSIDLTGINTSKVDNMSNMFYNCQSLTKLDLNNFNTKNVYSFDSTFELCSSLVTIEAADTFVTDNAVSSENMFKDCYNIVGNGRTTYDASIIDKTYARVDTLVTPGYFSHGNLTVKFVTNGGTSVEDKIIEYGGKIDAPVTTRDNYTFINWYETSNYSKVFNFNNIITHDLILYARWVSNSRGGGGGGGGGGTVSGRIASASTLNIWDPVKENAIIACEKSKNTYVLVNDSIRWIYDPSGNKWGIDVMINDANISIKNVYVVVNNHTYYFDNNGKMVTGWVKDASGRYYAFEWEKTLNEGMMITGWRLINNKWYYFMPTGELLTNAITPDGYIVDNAGEWHPEK